MEYNYQQDVLGVSTHVGKKQHLVNLVVEFFVPIKRCKLRSIHCFCENN